MKRQIIYFLVCLFGWMFTSCYKDLSTLDTQSIPSVVIDTAGIPELHKVFQYGRLKIDPEVSREGLTDKDFTYEWRINTVSDGSEKHYIGIGNEMHLDTVITLLPDAKPYSLWYRVTDNTNGLQYSIIWSVLVGTSLGDGVLVADTKDGTTTDFSLIMNSRFTEQHTGEEVVKRNLYTQNNEGHFEGLVKSMMFTKGVIGNKTRSYLLALTDHSMTEISLMDFTFNRANRDLFYDPGAVRLKPQQMVRTPQNTQCYVEEGRIYVWKLGNSNNMELTKIGLPVSGDYVVDQGLSVTYTNAYVGIMFYDREHTCFWHASANVKTSAQVVTATEGQFQPDRLPPMECKYAHLGKDQEHRFLMKEKAASKYCICTFYSNKKVPTAKMKYDIPDCPELAEAIDYVFCENQNVMYFATPRQIYAITFGAGEVKVEPRYEAPTGEEITGLTMFRQAWYILNPQAWDPVAGGTKIPMPTHENTLLMSTYNGKEGKLWSLPVTHLGIGNIDKANAKYTGGFGRILSVTTQD